MEKKEDVTKVLGNLLIMDIHHGVDYTCTVSGNKELERVINNFPYSFKGSIEVLNELENNDNFYNLIHRKVNLIRYAINKHGNTIHISNDLFQVRPMELSHNIGDIGIIKKYSAPAPNMENQQYSLDVFYLENTKYCDYMLSLFENAIKEEKSKNNEDDEEVGCSSDENSDFNHLSGEMMEKYKDIWGKMALSIVNEYEITEFLHFSTCLGTEDFFSYDKPFKLNQFDKNWTITIKEKRTIQEKPKSEETDLDEAMDNLAAIADGAAPEEKSEPPKEEEVELKFDYIFVAPRINQYAPQVQDTNKAMFSKLVEYQVMFMSLINLKYSRTKMNLICPKKDGIGIWNRENDVAGMRELFDMIVEKYEDYFSITEDIIEYYSFNNYLISDKPSMQWLTNNVRKYSEILLCNYDDSLLDIKDELPIPNSFGFLYSDSPRLLESFLEGKMPKKTNISVNACDVTSLDFAEKMNQIASAKYIFMDSFDVNIMANALAVSTVPVLPDTVRVLGLEENVHYVTKSNYTDKLKHTQLKKNCKNYYENNVRPDAVARRLLNHVFVRGI